jgi:predicted ATPase
LWSSRLSNGEYLAALAIAEQFMEIAPANDNPVDLALADRAIGLSYHFLGDQIKARKFLQQMVVRPVGNARKSLIVRYHYDPLISGRMRYAWVLWLLGQPEKANQIIKASLDEVISLDHTLSMCIAMGFGPCPVALACGDFDAAEEYIAYVIDHASKHRLRGWQAWARCMQGVLLIRLGNAAAGLDMLQPTLDQVPERKSLWFAMFQVDLAPAMAATGKEAEALASVNESLADAETKGGGWQLAELLRVKGEILLRQDVEAAECCFQKSLDLARRQSALSWELRTATSLARLRVEQGRAAEARVDLESVYSQFVEGFDTADLVEARVLLDSLRRAAAGQRSARATLLKG